MEAPGPARSMAARGAKPTSFLSCHRASMWPPGRGDFLVSNFHPGAIPGNLVRNDSDGEEVLAGKWGGLFLGYLLGKNFRRNDDAWGGERACTPGRQEPPGPTPLAAPPALFPSAPLSPSGLELRANSIGAFSGFHEATPLTSSAERATGVT